jgi:hypothetical protein
LPVFTCEETPKEGEVVEITTIRKHKEMWVIIIFIKGLEISLERQETEFIFKIKIQAMVEDKLVWD